MMNLAILPLVCCALASVGCGLVETANRPGNIDQAVADGRIRPVFAARIKERSVAIGMSREEVVFAWGRPHDINSRVSSFGRSEQWVYRRGQFDAQYVYFENGVVTSISSS